MDSPDTGPCLCTSKLFNQGQCLGLKHFLAPTQTLRKQFSHSLGCPFLLERAPHSSPIIPAPSVLLGSQMPHIQVSALVAIWG